jgi:dihydrofolate synthase/folylpolyglutamate synthase
MRESIKWVYSFDKYGSKLELDRITIMMKRLGNPEKQLKIIHVTGTNGKGSVCQFVGSILHQAGYKTGVYISPHLERFSERMTINGQEILNEDIDGVVAVVQPVVDAMIDEGNPPTFFEIVTAMAFVYFTQQQVDFAVVEVGLGGRFDATNIVLPMVSVITNISLEHRQQLGENVESIAFEKAGIIKKQVPVITAAEGKAREVISRVAREHHAPLTVIEQTSWQRLSASLENQEFLVHGFLKDYQLSTGLLGRYQGENIALAVAVVEHLQMLGVFVADRDIGNGITHTLNPGRMEIISENPMLLLDGAHNPTGIKMLKESLEHDFSYHRLILILGILADKDITDMVPMITPLSEIIIIAPPQNPRACDPKRLQEKIVQSGFSKQLLIKETVTDAIDYSKTVAATDDLICITGSLFTVGEARTYLLKQVSKPTVGS